MGVFEILFALFLSEQVVASFGMPIALRGMFVHRSQNLWYRQIFVCISAYSYVNSFSVIK